MQYTVRRSERARRVRVVVEPTGAVEVVLPASRGAARGRCGGARAAAVDRAAAGGDRDGARGRRARGNRLPFLGETLRARREPGRTRAHRRGDTLLYGDRAQIERWYRRMAREEVVPLLDEAVDALGVDYTSLRIANQRTRWGSCSTNGAMSFNWRLLLAPPEILDYVVWHEACHLVHMDHSQRFWSLLERHLPDYRTPRRWLRDNGATLVLG